MPTNTYASSRFATMTADEVMTEQQRMLEQWAADDAARALRFAAILASLDR